MKESVSLSIIVNAYNVEEYIEKCLESIIIQTNIDYEIICVNDGSTDSTGIIIDKYTRKSDKIRAVAIPHNRGLVNARKIGVDAARGEYILFVDADDYLCVGAIEKLTEIIRCESADIVQFSVGIERCNNDDEPIEWLQKFVQPYEKKVTGVDILYKAYVSRSFSTSLWGKLYKREIVKKAFSKIKVFENFNMGEDLYIFFWIVFFAKEYIGLKGEKLYVYRRGCGMTSKQDVEVFESLVKQSNACNYCYCQLKSKPQYVEIVEFYAKRVIEDIMRFYEKIHDENEKEKCICIMKKYIKGLKFFSSRFEKVYGKTIERLENENSARVGVSVVVPTHNSEQYLHKCLETITNQTLNNIEVICIDDGSTDNTLDVLEKYRLKDPRIRIIKQKNKGAGNARNTGLRAAIGKYVIFLDSDDFFELNMLEELYNAAEKRKTDIVIFDGKKFNNKSHEIIDECGWLQKNCIPEKDVFTPLDIKDKIFQCCKPNPWMRFYNRFYLHEIKEQYQEIQNSNDVYMGYISMLRANRISVMPQKYVYYRFNNNASLQGNKSCNPTCFMQAIECLKNSMISLGILDIYENSFIGFVIDSMIWNLNSVKSDYARAQIFNVFNEKKWGDWIFNKEDSCYIDLNKKKMLVNSILQYNSFPVRNAELCCLKNKSVKSAPLVSVIIPVYNVEHYIEETLNSIMNQTLKNIEIICIDDGSSDKSLKVLEDICRRDKRISIYHHNNTGLGAVRNIGIKLSRGEYLYFMDSDDLLDVCALEELYNFSHNHTLDVLYFDGNVFYEDDQQGRRKELGFNYERKSSYYGVYEGLELFYEMRMNHEFFQSACLQFLRRNFICDCKIMFPEGVIHEDNAFSFKVALSAEKAMHYPKPFFHRRVRGGSIMTTGVTFKNCFGYFISYKESLEYLNSLTKISPLVRKEAEVYVYRMLENAIEAYEKMPYDNRGFHMGIIKEYSYFTNSVLKIADKNIEIYRLKKKIDEMQKKESAEYVKMDLGNIIKDNRYYDQLLELKDYVKELEKELIMTRMSISCRIGRGITFFPRMISNLIKHKK